MPWVSIGAWRRLKLGASKWRGGKWRETQSRRAGVGSARLKKESAFRCRNRTGVSRVTKMASIRLHYHRIQGAQPFICVRSVGVGLGLVS